VPRGDSSGSKGFVTGMPLGGNSCLLDCVHGFDHELQCSETSCLGVVAGAPCRGISCGIDLRGACVCREGVAWAM
jgi:hypothetical protein